MLLIFKMACPIQQDKIIEKLKKLSKNRNDAFDSIYAYECEFSDLIKELKALGPLPRLCTHCLYQRCKVFYLKDNEENLCWRCSPGDED